MFKELAVLPLYLACQSLAPQNISDNETCVETLQKFPKLAFELPQGYTVFPDVEMAYKVYKKNVKWAQAQKYCVGEGADLAVVDSFKKVEYIMDLKGPDRINVHIGIHRFFDNVEWIQVKDGLPPARIAWRINSHENENDKKCTVIFEDGSGVLASDCGRSYYFVCEIPIFRGLTEFRSPFQLQNDFDIAMSPELQKPAKKLPPGYTEFPDTGVAYKMYKKNKIWGEAKKYCTGEGANLAVIDSFQKIEYVMDLRGPDQIDVHVGIHRFFDDNEWVEIRTGLPPTSIPWRREPNLEDKSRKCSVIDHIGNGIAASHCTGLYYFVCEIPI